MERVSILEIAAILTAKSGLKKKDADRFATTIFEVVKDGLATDRLVKIKGLGTFKVINIESRESVNVNTGERVLIEGHEKVTFTPDATMKELVNKPFSQFETVVLNEGVEFDDPVEATEEPPVEATEEPPVEATVESPVEATESPVPESPEVPEVPLAPLAPESPESPEVPLAPLAPLASEAPSAPAPPEAPAPPAEPAPLTVPPSTEDKTAETNNDEINDEEMNNSHDNRPTTLKWLIVALIACAASFVAGYYVGSYQASKAIVLDTETIMGADDAVAPIVTDSLKPAVNDTVKAAPKQVAAETPKAEPAKEPAPAATGNEEYKKYEQMDGRVRTGAYRIVGTAEEVKAKAGETLGRISRRYLGPDMECYVEVYNGLKASAVLSEGQTIRIPKLEVKKKKVKK